jgi:cysteine desulfuration protein SufE
MDSTFNAFLEDLKKSESNEAIYQKIILLGKTSPFKKIWAFSEDDRVTGCQSLLYVRCFCVNGLLSFEFHSDALISQGLAALLIHFYNGVTLKQMLSSPPSFFKDLNLGHLLSIGRSNGVNSLYKKMLEKALATCKAT